MFFHDILKKYFDNKIQEEQSMNEKMKKICKLKPINSANSSIIYRFSFVLNY